ncbi:CdaR family transcriptional regulator [Clostridium akagii]|uniref:CdaR family transcriptional regulator n=1 Tax=Clostridium akagii TaxID=91623 RepID=UPI000AE4EB78|nr:sugar diacid recognition domain-containing protein [Clostridium akagii]
MKLSKPLAQKIVYMIMKVIPYNVIIADEQGVIIGSGDIHRINQVHTGAKQVLKFKKIVEIYDDSYEGVKRGVNSPIFFAGKLVGVIGISGEPSIVKSFSELARVTVELLINQEYTLNEKNVKEQRIEKFLCDLSYITDDYSENFIERGLSLGINLNILHTAVVISFNEETSKKIKSKLNEILGKNEYFYMLNSYTIVLFMNSDETIIKRLSACFDNEYSNVNFGIGLNEIIIAKSVKQALTALNIGKKLENNKNVFLFKDLHFISMLAKFKGDSELSNIIEKLKKEAKQIDLLKTLVAYVYNNEEINITSEKLHIHRNTLNYRLEKIHEISGKNPRNVIELFELFTAYLISIL